MKEDGALFHAKHAFMPNSLGYCGPDENGTIREHLEEGRRGEELVDTLKEFEAAYPFLKLIARNTGREALDYAVPEAYWIGNSLLDSVQAADFYRFSQSELKGNGMMSLQNSFRDLDGMAVPHHTFYVMSTYVGRGGDGPKPGTERPVKLEELINNCRISWGRVKEVKRSKLAVEYRPLRIGEEGFELGRPKKREVDYNPQVKPFGAVRAGDVVSMHWGYACDVLSKRQVSNIESYTTRDIGSINLLMKKRSG
jgi:hypothetical protein